MNKYQKLSLKDYLLEGSNGYENIIIEDFNEFISDLFPNKNVFININHKQQNVKYEVLDSTFGIKN